MDFSNIRRQLNEMPMPRHAQLGDQFEAILADRILPALFPNEAPFQRVFGGGRLDANGNPKAQPKTDIKSENHNYSVKTGKKPNPGMEDYAAADVQTASMPQSGLSKLMIGQRSLEDPLMQAYLMKFGHERGLKNVFRDLSGFDFGDDEKILTGDQLRERFPEQFEALKTHLDDNKEAIFNNMVRQKRKNARNDQRPYVDYDPKPIDRFIHLSKPDINRLNGRMEILDMGDDRVKEAVENRDWQFDDKQRIFLGKEGDPRPLLNVSSTKTAPGKVNGRMGLSSAVKKDFPTIRAADVDVDRGKMTNVQKNISYDS